MPTWPGGPRITINDDELASDTGFSAHLGSIGLGGPHCSWSGRFATTKDPAPQPLSLSRTLFPTSEVQAKPGGGPASCTSSGIEINDADADVVVSAVWLGCLPDADAFNDAARGEVDELLFS